eukprot:TRINITY_DN2290_c0_g3_i1.p1 TRINITY_DN2290_c0_g3~~TRINITY_DN2290_c0_g3_i1.p1  ORF type:complete len:752 (+),score=103.53 TRINITY_DN2290_c0_g3_i1:164-2257(+)
MFLNKSILKRHKKKCKVIKATNEMADLSMKPNFTCRMCFKKINKFNEHAKNCSELRRQVDLFNRYEPTIRYFGEVDTLKIPVELVVELLKKVPTAEKMHKFRPRGGTVQLTFLDIMIARKCSFPIWKEFFTDVSFDVLLDGVCSRKDDTIPRMHMIYSSLPGFPLDVLEFLVDNISPEKRCSSDGLDRLASDCSAETMRICLKGFVVGEHIDLEEYIEILNRGVTGSLDRDKLIEVMWPRLTYEQKLFRYTGDAVIWDQKMWVHSILTCLIRNIPPLKLATYKLLCEGMPKEFGCLKECSTEELKELPELSNEIAPECRRFLSEWMGISVSKYHLSETPLRLKPLSVNSLKSSLKRSCPGMELDGALNVFLQHLVLDYDAIDPLVLQVMFTYMKGNPFEDIDGGQVKDKFLEMALLSIQTPAERKKLVNILIKRFLSKYGFVTSFADSLRALFLATAGLCSPEIIKKLKSLTNKASAEERIEICGNDGFYLLCMSTLQFPVQFFSKKMRLKTWIDKAEEFRNKEDWINAADFWWRCLLIDVKQTSVILKDISIEDWCIMVSKCQKAENFEIAIKLAHIGLLANPKNEDRFVLFHAAGKCYRSLRDISGAAMCFQHALCINPDSVQSLFESGVCYNSLGLYDEAVAYFCECLRRDPDHEFAFRALKKIVMGAENSEVLRTETYEKIFKRRECNEKETI